MKKRLWLFLVLALILSALGWSVTRRSAAKPNTAATKVSAPASSTSRTTPSPQLTGFNKNQYSLSDPASIWIVVDKARPLNPKTYAPKTLVVPSIPLRSNITDTEKYVSSAMAEPLDLLIGAAKLAGLRLDLESGYRSYNFQISLYNGYVKQQGQAAADTQSARPGYSEHQTGLAADLGGATTPSCNVAQCFATTPEGVWLAANAYKYGFIIRYPQNLTNVTGYEYEPWHVRYVGTALATQMHTEGVQTLEQFFGLPNAPDYP